MDVIMLDISREGIRLIIENKLRSYFGVTAQDARHEQIFDACAQVIREFMSRSLAEYSESRGDARHVHYMSMEFLIGRSLQKNAFNLGILDGLSGALEDMGYSASDIFESEPDAGLGNGGLGRLAACYMDAMATQGVNATGYSICYELGIFRQKLRDGGQTEEADYWLEEGENWLVPSYDESVEVRFGGHLEAHWDFEGKYVAEHVGYDSVLAIPRDMLIPGYGGEQVNKLRLWEAKSTDFLDMLLFSSGRYVESLESRILTEVISKVLYPADDHPAGKELRLKQQYFFVSATVQSVLREHRKRYGTILNLHEKHVFQINDTHPAIVIPELMRLLMDEDGLGWDEAWEIVTQCVAYTNHTILSEALERWPQDLVASLLPRLWEVLCEINRRWRDELSQSFGNDGWRIGRNLVIDGGAVNMANLCLAACFKVNGVSGLHGDILKSDLFADVCGIMPDKFMFVTNGIDHRRWLTQINPGLHALITDVLGSDDYMLHPNELTKLRAFTNDESVLWRVEEIKRHNKVEFTNYIHRDSGFLLNSDAIFDVQVKRLHEYKRQLLCAMEITHLHNMLRDNPNMDFLPRTFIFGAKAASGYYVAKRIIRLIMSLAKDINYDPICKDKLQVFFLENYRVSLAEHLMPAAQVSEQISTAGKEASGTGNMKLMINGAVTIGTLDGANVEMYESLGDDNMFLFGMRTPEVNALRERGYVPSDYAKPGTDAARVLDRFTQGFSNGENFADLASRLLTSDEFMLLADFEDYKNTHNRMYDTLLNTKKRAELSLINTAEAGRFAADRAIAEYARDIWNVDVIY